MAASRRVDSPLQLLRYGLVPASAFFTENNGKEESARSRAEYQVPEALLIC